MIVVTKSGDCRQMKPNRISKGKTLRTNVPPMAPGAKPIMAATVDTVKKTRKKVLGEKEVKNHLMMAPNSRGRNRFH